SVVVGSRARPGTTTTLERITPAPQSFSVGRDFTPHGGSLAGAVSGEVVFVRYGLTPPDWSDDDYGAVDMQGKIALALDGGPAYLGDVRPTRLEKLMAAHRRGAAGILIVSDVLPALESTPASVKILAGTITAAAADALLAPAGP